MSSSEPDFDELSQNTSLVQGAGVARICFPPWHTVFALVLSTLADAIMSDDGRNYLAPSAGSSRRINETPSTSSSSTTNLSPADDAVDVSLARHLYYPCTGNVDIKTYIDARMYGLSFRRLHDEWVVLGRPRIDTSHWPRMIGHRGLPNSPEDFVPVGEYYDRKIYGQVLLMEQGKAANADRPLDDFLVSMVTTAAVVNADFAVFRLARSQPSVEEAVTQRTWYQTFTTFLQDSIRHFINERRVCDRLPPHQCVTPLLFGQASSMSLPDLLQAMTYQVEIFQNLFPNFGEHIGRCAAASTQPQWASSSVSGMPHSIAAHPAASGPNQLTAYDSATRGDEMQQQQQQSAMDPNRPLSVVTVPAEVEHRNDLFVTSIDPTIRCDVPVERVAGIIDSRLRVSASASASSASTPASIKMSAPLANTRAGSSFSSMTSQRSSDADSQKRKNSEVSIDDERLTLRPPLPSLTSWGGETVGRSASEEYSMVTPDEVEATIPSRSLSNPAVSHFSSLPATPTEGIATMTHLSAQDAAHPYFDRRPHRSNTTLSVTSTSDPDTRKRSRAEQNREKMKAYHKRVMQQREALAGMLADLTAHVGSVPLPSSRQAGSSSVAGSHTSDETTTMTKSTPRNTSEPSWSITLRNKQKQESKARLRKREIDQVHELRLYASYAMTILLRSSESPMTGSYQKSSGMSGSHDEHWRGQPVSEADKHTTHAIVRAFARNRSNWTALISAEQRLMGEVAKLTLSGDEERMLRGAGSNEVIKALIDRIQMEERAGTFVLPATDSTSMYGGPSSYDSRGSVASSSASPFLTTGSMASRPPTIQQLARHSGFSPSLMHPGSLVISPGSSDYGPAVSPSGVTRPAGADETGDYFGQDRRRYASRYSDSSDTAPSVFSTTISPSYNTTEPTNAHFANRSPSGGSMMSPPSVLAPTYSYNAMYAGGGGASSTQHQRMGMQQGMDRQMAGGGGMSQGQQTPAMEHAQLRMSTSYDARGYGQASTEGAGGSRMELHPPQSLQAPSFGYANSMTSPSGAPSGGQQVYGMHSPDSTSTLQPYRSNPSQYTPPSHQQNPYDQQGGYGGQQ